MPDAVFPRVKKKSRAYDADQVDAFLARARASYDAPDGTGAAMSAADLRTVSFDLRAGGYSAAHVDAALDRLEDVFAAREREAALAALGEQGWRERARVRAQAIQERLSRPAGHKFARTGVFTSGYDRNAVDRFGVRVLAYLGGEGPLSLNDVRTVAFRTRVNGYREDQVDALLDAVIEVMQAVR